MSVQMPDINLLLLLPEIILSVAAMGLLLIGAWQEERQDSELLPNLSLAAVVVAAIATLSGLADPRATTLDGQFVHDPFSTFMKLFMYVATTFPILMSVDYLKRYRMHRGEYYVLMLCALLGGMIMASAGSFLVLYLGLELMSLSIYVLAAFRRDDTASNEAGLKYFVLGSMASGLLLYGISLVYGATGTFSFATLQNLVGSDGFHGGMLMHMGVLFVVAGLAFKIAAAPFHMWAPDVYEGAPTSVTAFMAALPKVAAFAAVSRVLLEAFGPLQAFWGPAVQLLAVASMAVGALAAIAQTNFKRMLAYSSIGHVGYILIGFAAGNELGSQAVLLYLAIYIFMNLGTFAMILIFSREGVGEEIGDYKGLAHKRPLLAFVMALLMFSMAGVPPLAGFIGKLYIFMAAVKANMIGLAIVGVLFSAIGAFYYLRIVKIMYFDQAESSFQVAAPLPSQLVIAVSTAAILIWGVFPGSLLSWALASVQSLH
ncbi:MAG: NADH-quinone oxidoreductase subunit NuoN [Magnetococcales bacterium]|nr:NADH-quinone oxidoreductase subunit NuoN [Magnetococcales bacterium]